MSLKKPWISVPKKSVIITISLDIKKSVIICDNLWTKKSVDKKLCGLNKSLLHSLQHSPEVLLIPAYKQKSRIEVDVVVHSHRMRVE